MSSHAGTPNVGAMNPKLKTSPMLEKKAEESCDRRRQVSGDAACLFNGELFATGEFVRSDAMILECRRGLWVEIARADQR